MRILTAPLLGLLVLSACGGEKDTPADVMQAYDQLKAQLDGDLLGHSIARLEAFKSRHAQYRIATAVAAEIASLRDQVKGRFHMARELARGGGLGRAETILKDLATSLSDTDDGRLAQQFLQFDFYLFKANLLMNERRLAEAEAAVRQVLGSGLTDVQTSQAERVLDAIHSAVAAGLANACRTLQLLLQQFQAENGTYPTSLGLDNLSLADSRVQDDIRAALSAIENYQATGDGFSFVAVSKDGRMRRRVTERGTEKG